MTEEEQGNKPTNESESPKDKNAMKAFYRAMYAGADPDPDDYGIQVDKKEDGNPRDSVSSAELSRMQQELEEMEKRCLEAENLYKRMAADFENYRKRMQKEKEEFAAVGIQKAIEAILPALDDMDLAVTKLTPDVDPKNIIDSLNMVYKRFARCLEQIGIKQMDVIGKQFDPRFHEPVQQVVDNNVPDGSIVYQLRPGYQYNDKILRPSLVNVATGGSEPEPETEEEVVEEVVEEIIIEEEVVETSEEDSAEQETAETEANEDGKEASETEESSEKEASVEEAEPSSDNAEAKADSKVSDDDDLASTQDIPAMEIQEKLKQIDGDTAEKEKE